MKNARPGILTAAALLLALVSLSRFAGVFSLFVSPPLEIKVIISLEGLVGLVAAYGLWHAKRWGMIVALIISVLNILVITPSLIPGLVIQSPLVVLILGGIAVALSVLIIVLIVLPSARQAYAQA